ncbi:MAG: 4-alpha-glucanotransferase [Clostridium sp.]
MMRKSGIILPIFSLPSDNGIGTFGKEAYRFVDFLKKGSVGYWQILPVGPTSFGDSPYQSFSTFAGNPYFIDLDVLVEKGLLKKEDILKYNYGDDRNDINYGVMYENRYKILKEAYKNFPVDTKSYLDFKEENKKWLYDYALFMSIKDLNKGIPWKEWEEDIRFRRTKALVEYSNLLSDEIEFYIFMQYEFYSQWDKLKKYANSQGVKIIGDIPIYVAEDSADVWSNPEFFELDEDLLPKKVSGCPPDAFSDTGQLWGNPVYNWDNLKKYGYKWWIERIEASLKLFDCIRIDHFRGFESYWAIPYGDEVAINGTWEKGPGQELFDEIKKKIGEVDIIAEDLGYITKEVRELLDYCGYPGMRVLQFAFDPNGDSEYLPHNYERNTIVYTGTHDNDTLKSWFKSLSEEERDFLQRYTGMKDENDGMTLVRLAFSSVANTAIIQIQDLLNLDKEARINVPSTLGTNWRWRMNKEDINEELSLKLKELNALYGRRN